MKIGVVSDSHDHVRPLGRAIELFRQGGVEAILHAGDYVAPFSAKLLTAPNVPADIPVYAIFGNNDGERQGLSAVLPQLQDGPIRLELGGRTVVMHHDVAGLTDEDLAGADVVVTGHTHEVVNKVRKGVLHLNPGECCGVLTGQSTAAILDTQALTAEILDVQP